MLEWPPSTARTFCVGRTVLVTRSWAARSRLACPRCLPNAAVRQVPVPRDEHQLHPSRLRPARSVVRTNWHPRKRGSRVPRSRGRLLPRTFVPNPPAHFPVPAPIDPHRSQIGAKRHVLHTHHVRRGGHSFGDIRCPMRPQRWPRSPRCTGRRTENHHCGHEPSHRPIHDT